MAEDLGRRAAAAIDNAQLHSQTRDVALQLQRAVLPEDLSAIPGWRVAAVYEPGGRAEVGGDFYDAIPLPDGRLAVFIGDVMGHGLAAAAAMATLRASVRAFLSVDPAPAAVLGHLERMFSQLGITRLVTLVYAVLDPATAELSVVSAGHHPPLVLRRSGEVTAAPTPPRRPLGTEPDTCAPTTFPFVHGDTLLLFTDGLVERRGEHIDAGLDRLRANIRVLARADLAGGLRQLVAQVHEDGGADDVTALAVRGR